MQGQKMTTDYFEAEKVGGSRKHIEIEVRVKADYVIDFMKEIQEKTINEVLDLIDTAQTYKMASGDTDTYIDKRVLKEAVEALAEGEQE